MCCWSSDAGGTPIRGGRFSKEITWQPDAPSVVFYCGDGTKDRGVGVIDLPCVVGGQNMQIRMHVVPGEFFLERCGSEYIIRGARVDKETNHMAPMTEGPSGHV